MLGVGFFLESEPASWGVCLEAPLHFLHGPLSRISPRLQVPAIVSGAGTDGRGKLLAQGFPGLLL